MQPTYPPLSILIPIYRYDCEKLLKALISQAEALSLQYEIVLGNDCSGAEWETLYTSYSSLSSHIRVYHSLENLGAGRMRNRLVEQARYDYLLMLDSDVLPSIPNFLSTYLSHADPETVVVGGFMYSRDDLSESRLLRYYYGCLVESKPAEERNTDPYRSFIAMSVLAPLSVMQLVAYPQEMGMGYEDARFGFSLKQARIKVHHIHCPVPHSLKETSMEFLSTTRRYIRNLHKHQNILRPCGIKLLDTFDLVKRLGLVPLCSLKWKILRPFLEKQLCSRRPSMRLFALYKLLYLSSVAQSAKCPSPSST